MLLIVLLSLSELVIATGFLVGKLNTRAFLP